MKYEVKIFNLADAMITVLCEVSVYEPRNAGKGTRIYRCAYTAKKHSERVVENSRIQSVLFQQAFSEAMGMPVTGYIRIRKLQNAVVSLLEGKKILAVAMMYLFESHEGFTGSFARLFGSTPGIVRRFMTSCKVPNPLMAGLLRSFKASVTSCFHIFIRCIRRFAMIADCVLIRMQ